MYSSVILSLTLLSCWVYAINADTEDVQEICQWESFNATCKSDEVILMKTARYGRMKLGKCITTDYFTGCSANVIYSADEYCSGKRHCEIPVPDPKMFKLNPCRKDLTAYLEASYKCLKVLGTEAKDACKTRDALHITEQSGYLIPNEYTGDAGCPWEIKVSPGQRINFTVYDFKYLEKYHSNILYDEDKVAIEDGTKPLVYVSLQPDIIRRKTFLYKSESNKVKVHFISEGNPYDNIMRKYLLYFEGAYACDIDKIEMEECYFFDSIKSNDELCGAIKKSDKCFNKALEGCKDGENTKSLREYYEVKTKHHRKRCKLFQSGGNLERITLELLIISTSASIALLVSGT